MLSDVVEVVSDDIVGENEVGKGKEGTVGSSGDILASGRG